MATNRYNTKTHYNYGSAAPDIYREVQKPHMPNTQRRKQLQKQNKEKKKADFKRRFSYFISIVTVFIACAAFVWGCAVLSEKQHELKTAKSEVQQLKSQVNTTKSLIASATNLDHIKEVATSELNMSEPLAHQIVFLDIAKTSYTVIE
ncbi:MAG: hypothetical protein GX366_08445 [Epulopiscium sp.]|nr:hypothetical protein [Candidatus Epulonipiscium sp.]